MLLIISYANKIYAGDLTDADLAKLRKIKKCTKVFGPFSSKKQMKQELPNIFQGKNTTEIFPAKALFHSAAAAVAKPITYFEEPAVEIIADSTDEVRVEELSHDVATELRKAFKDMGFVTRRGKFYVKTYGNKSRLIVELTEADGAFFVSYRCIANKIIVMRGRGVRVEHEDQLRKLDHVVGRLCLLVPSYERTIQQLKDNNAAVLDILSDVADTWPPESSLVVAPAKGQWPSSIRTKIVLNKKGVVSVHKERQASIVDVFTRIPNSEKAKKTLSYWESVMRHFESDKEVGSGKIDEGTLKLFNAAHANFYHTILSVCKKKIQLALAYEREKKAKRDAKSEIEKNAVKMKIVQIKQSWRMLSKAESKARERLSKIVKALKHIAPVDVAVPKGSEGAEGEGSPAFTEDSSAPYEDEGYGGYEEEDY